VHGCETVARRETTTTGNIQQTVAQGENPAQVSKQDQETIRTRSYTLPSGSRMEEARLITGANGSASTNVQSVVVSAPMPVLEREETRAKTELGAAQKDSAREIGAKLARLYGTMQLKDGAEGQRLSQKLEED
jgi:hypothetical protein